MILLLRDTEDKELHDIWKKFSPTAAEPGKHIQNTQHVYWWLRGGIILHFLFSFRAHFKRLYSHVWRTIVSNFRDGNKRLQSNLSFTLSRNGPVSSSHKRRPYFKLKCFWWILSNLKPEKFLIHSYSDIILWGIEEKILTFYWNTAKQCSSEIKSIHVAT